MKVPGTWAKTVPKSSDAIIGVSIGTTFSAPNISDHNDTAN